MNIQLKSDLHYEGEYASTKLVVPKEQSIEYVSPHADVLLLAGDICNIKDIQIDYFIDKFKDCTIPILYTPGNHEYWNGDFVESRKILAEKLKDTNITLMDRDWKIIKDKNGEEVLFIAATLWTNLSSPPKASIAKGTHDFRFIKGLNTEKWTNRHIEEFWFIQSMLTGDFKHMKKVVMTHYLPSKFSVPLRFKTSEGNCIFVADCEDMMQQNYSPVLWVHGHTHDSNDYKIRNTRVVSNPHGGVNRDVNPNYNNDLIITI